MPDLLQIGGATEEMSARVSAAFTIHKASDQADLTGWLAEHGDKITHVQTNGHDGVKPDVMAALTNLKMISCYGVGYDNIDAQRGRAARDHGHAHAERPERGSCDHRRASHACLLPRTSAR